METDDLGQSTNSPFNDPDSLQTSELRKLYRSLDNEAKRADKMGRSELLKKVKDLLPVSTREAMSKPPIPAKADCCINALIDAFRAYVRHETWVATGNRNSDEAVKHLEDARKMCQKAVGYAVDTSGNGWEKANRVFGVLDRAMLKMRNNFTDILVSSCVMSSLLSEKHVADMEGLRQ